VEATGNNLEKLEIKFIDSTELEVFWPTCEPLIKSGLAGSDGEVNTDHLLIEITAQRAHLIVGFNSENAACAAMVVQFIDFPNYKIAHVCSIGGRGVVENAQHWTTIKVWMKQQGALKVQGSCKPAQARLWQKLGFTDTYHMVRQDL
jgi:hypothetical protein